MTFTFGDAEPEDSWDRDDSPDEQLENLRRRVLLLLGAAALARDTDDRRQALAVIAALVAVARLRRLVGRDLVRADQLDEDIAFLYGRLP